MQAPACLSSPQEVVHIVAALSADGDIVSSSPASATDGLKPAIPVYPGYVAYLIVVPFLLLALIVLPICLGAFALLKVAKVVRVKLR
jgi:hypothetical protein